MLHGTTCNATAIPNIVLVANRSSCKSDLGLENFPLAHKQVFSFIKEFALICRCRKAYLFYFLYLKQGFLVAFNVKRLCRHHFICLHGLACMQKSGLMLRLKSMATCYTRRFSDYSSSCVASFGNQFKNSQHVAEPSVAQKIVPGDMLHGDRFSTLRCCAENR